jgi:hypothetical protein
LWDLSFGTMGAFRKFGYFQVVNTDVAVTSSWR